MKLILCLVLFSTLETTYGTDCMFTGVEITFGSLVHCDKRLGQFPPPSLCYKTGRNGSWKCNVELHSRFNTKMQFVFKEPAAATNPLFQLNIYWSLKSFPHHSSFISHIKINENNCGLHKIINFADQGSRCVHSSSLASIDTYYCNNRYQNGLVFDGTNRVARLCAFDIATGNCTCEGSCEIIPINPTTLMSTGGTLPNDMKNVTMNCSCNGGHDDNVWWFFPNGSRLYDYYYTSNVKPYITQGYKEMSSVLVIPTFNYPFAGTYTCGIGTSFPPSIMTITELKADTSSQQCSVNGNRLTPTPTTSTDGDKIIYIVRGARVRCSCFDQNGQRIYRRQKWFFQNGNVVSDEKHHYIPYSSYRQYVATLELPLINSSYNGIYTCGIGEDLSSTINTVAVQLITTTMPVISLRLVNHAYKNGGTALFSCQATGEPVPFINWYFNDTKVNTTDFSKYFISSPISTTGTQSTLIILNVSLLDVGRYTCHATNIAGRATSSGQLTVNIPAVVTKINPSYQTVSVFDSISISCTAKGYPSPMIHWMLRNEVVKNDSNTIISYYKHCSSYAFDGACVSSSTLYISYTLPFHSATYSCVAINSAGNDIKSAELDVAVLPPDMIIHPKSQQADLTQNATFTCSATGYDVKYQWTVGSGSFLTGINTNTLVIPDVRSCDDNTYTCVASNEGGNALSNGAKLTVTGLPDVTVTPSSQSVEVTRAAIFTTTVSGVGVENFMYQWRYNGTNITGETGDTLMITNVMENDSGDYECSVTNEYGDAATAAANLTVYISLPVILKYPEHVNVTFYEVAEFQCIVSGYHVNVTWLKPGSNLPRTYEVTKSGDEHNMTSVLKINNIIGYYAGNYCCNAVTKAGSVSACAALKVEAVPCPEIIIPPQMITVHQGEDVLFYCLAVSYSGLKYDWKTQDGSSLPSTARTYFSSRLYLGQATTFSTLFIPSAKQTYAKWYCCAAANKCGTTIQCAQLIVN